MRINLGCGDRYAPGWINVDWAGSPHRKDQEVDLTQPLPWPDESVEYIYAGHVLEHLTLEQCQGLLAELLRCSVDYGQLMVVGPDLPKAYQMLEEGTLDVPIESLLYGAERWSGDKHLWESSMLVTAELIRDAGWGDLTQRLLSDVAQSWPIADPRPQWQFAIHALKEPNAES